MFHIRSVSTRLVVHKAYSISRPRFSRYFSAQSKKNVVVFDIDETLCYTLHSDSQNPDKEAIDQFVEQEYMFRSMECPIIPLRWGKDVSYQVFRPYFGVLVNYLLSRNVRIAFFSAGTQERNLPLINTLLKHTLGEERLAELRQQNQFNIFSRHQMRKVDPAVESGVPVYDQGSFVKDLRPLLREGETIDDIILLDDNPQYCSTGQKEMLFTPYGMFAMEPKHFQIDLLRYKNNFYYFLGVFKNYFENREGLYAALPLRQAVGKMLVLHEKYDKVHWIPATSFEIEMVLIGLREVRNSGFPEAIFYGSQCYTVEDPTIPAHLFHHSQEAIENILDSVIAGKRALTEPTIIMFIRYLDELAVKHYEPARFKDKFETVKGLLMKAHEEHKQSNPSA